MHFSDELYWDTHLVYKSYVHGYDNESMYQVTCNATDPEAIVIRRARGYTLHVIKYVHEYDTAMSIFHRRDHGTIYTE